ncbi:MAG: exodeoxyribonuclease VII small subunit [Balneolaceae bacterium]
MSEEKKPTFEEALNQLETVVKRLEDPDVSLEESIDLYEQGMKLSAFCNETLENATLRIEKLHPDSSGGESPQ